MISVLPQIVILLFSIVFHEVAHGKMARWRGDPTAEREGRLTLNPIPHIDLFGTILLPLFLVLSRSPVLFGWAKPVPINPQQFHNMKRDIALVGASGPASNCLLALSAAFLFRLSFMLLGFANPLTHLMFFAVIINLVLAVFNMVPIPPLDGSRIVLGFLSDRAAILYERIERFGFLIIFGLLLTGFFDWLIWPIVIRLATLIVGREAMFLLSGG